MISGLLEKIVQHTMTEPIQSARLRINTKSDPRRINLPNFVAIYGNPKSGKTSMSRALSKSAGFLHLASDNIFSSHMAPCLANWKAFLADKPFEHFSVLRYVDSVSYDHDLFIACLSEELRWRLQYSSEVQTILLDGYVFKDYSRIFTDLKIPPERTLALNVSFNKGRHMVEEFDVTDHRYDAVLQYIRENFSAKCSNSIVPKSRYQSFQSLGLPGPKGGNSDSNTLKKYDASHLDEVLHATDRFVDIGCNAGYFCIRAADKTDGIVVGVDMVQSWLELGSQINNSIFLHNNIIFIKAEALEFLSENPSSFDVIHCASTYHYFRDRQIVFLREANIALAPNGLLVLEVELSNTEGEPAMLKRSRGVDSTPCTFPNRAMFLQQITGLFEIENEFESVFQSGSFYKRIYFHLRPVQQQAQFVLDKAQGNQISGWAMHLKYSQQEITLLIKINDEKEFITVANRHRPDLLSKSIHPTGNCGFALTLPATDTLSAGDTVEVYIGKVAGDKIVPLSLLISTKAC